MAQSSEPLSQVFALFLLYSGLSLTQGEPWRPLCQGAVSTLKHKVEWAGLSPDQHQQLYTAAAAFAYADFLILSGGSLAGEQIKVGDISIGNTQGTSRQNSETIREYFTKQVADILGASDFYFSTIGGESNASKNS